MSDTSLTRIAIAGAAGRMGQALSTLCLGDETLKLVGASEAPSYHNIGKDVGELIGSGKIAFALSPRKRRRWCFTKQDQGWSIRCKT